MHTPFIDIVPVHESLLAAVRCGLLELLRRRQARHQAQRTTQALAALDARTLHDLGFDRSEIGSLVSELHGAEALSRRRATCA